MKAFWQRLGRAFWRASQDGSLGCAKGAAYSALLSIFPVLSSITAILAQAKAEAVSARLTRILFDVAPPGTEELLQHTIAARGQRPVLLLIGAALLSAIAASGVILSLIDGFQLAFQFPSRRGFWRQRGVAMLLVLLAGGPALAASALLVYTGSVLNLLPAVAAVSVSTMLLYRLGPDLPRELRRLPVWPGALVATGLWTVATTAFVWYVRNLGTYNLIYGSLAAVIALLVWLYLLAASALVGCAFNAGGAAATSSEALSAGQR